MGKHLRFLVFGLVGMGWLAIPLPLPNPSPPAAHTITLQADDFTYFPASARVNPGDIVTLRFEPQDVVHGLAIDGYDVDLIAEPGRPEEITFEANRPGTFRIRCSVACGTLHPFMTGKLQVGPNLLLWRAVALTLLAAGGALAWMWRRNLPEVRS